MRARAPTCVSVCTCVFVCSVLSVCFGMEYLIVQVIICVALPATFLGWDSLGKRVGERGLCAFWSIYIVEFPDREVVKKETTTSGAIRSCKRFTVNHNHFNTYIYTVAYKRFGTPGQHFCYCE